MFVSFDEVFHPEKKWAYKKLSGNSPCNECEIYKEHEMKALYGTIAERQYAELPESCNTCIPKLNWQIDCMRKLAWYEKNDPNLKDEDSFIMKRFMKVE